MILQISFVELSYTIGNSSTSHSRPKISYLLVNLANFGYPIDSHLLAAMCVLNS